MCRRNLQFQSKPPGDMFPSEDSFRQLTGACTGRPPGEERATLALSSDWRWVLGRSSKRCPHSARRGALCTSWEQNLTGATGVSFKGTAATFAIVSSSEIKTIVPTGATTGFVSVSTPSGTLSSNVVFWVAP